METNNEFSDSISSLMNTPTTAINSTNATNPTEFPHKEFEKQNNNPSTNSSPGKPTEVLNIGIQEEQQHIQLQETIQEQENTINKLKFYLQQQNKEQLNQKEQNKTIFEKIKNINQKEILITIILFVLLSTPFFKNILKQYLPFTSTDNNINFIGLILSALILVILTIVFKCTY